jgi:Rrf2 family iron-sulfur cluster assembly transcriptional regulator
LRASVALARLQSQGAPVSINHLAEAENISSVFLEQIFFRLRKAGIVNSVRGPGGGFSFAKPLEQLTVREILLAAGEELELTACDKRVINCKRMVTCTSHSVWDEVTNIINRYLEKITLAMVLRRETTGSEQPGRALAKTIPAEETA